MAVNPKRIEVIYAKRKANSVRISNRWLIRQDRIYYPQGTIENHAAVRQCRQTTDALAPCHPTNCGHGRQKDHPCRGRRKGSTSFHPKWQVGGWFHDYGRDDDLFGALSLSLSLSRAKLQYHSASLSARSEGHVLATLDPA